MSRTFLAKYPGRCSCCGQSIRKNDMCRYVDGQIRLANHSGSQVEARSSNPYAHWNEDAKWMEYMERDR